MSLVIFIIFGISILSLFIGFVILELHPRLTRSFGNVMKFAIGGVIFTALSGVGLYFLSNGATRIFENMLDIVIIFVVAMGSIVGGGLGMVMIFGKR